jgi:hypothetical protein
MQSKRRRTVITLVIASVLTLSGASLLRADNGTCSGVNITLPFLDVAGNGFFCQIAAAYFSGLTNGTSPTTYSPNDNVTREQMAAFVTRTLDQSLKRGSQRAVAGQWWTPQALTASAMTEIGDTPQLAASDGTDIWVANWSSDTVSRVRASDGSLIGTWTGANDARGVLVAAGRVFVTGSTWPEGKLYQIDPTQPPGAVTTLTSVLGAGAHGIAYDGSRIWTANGHANGSSVSRVTLNPVSVTTFTGFSSARGILYDGANIWVTNTVDDTLLKLDSNGNILQTVALGNVPYNPVFDGANIWVPNRDANSVSVVRAATGAVLATLTGNGLNRPRQAAFDGERILVTNYNGHSVSLWKAADLTPLGSFTIGPNLVPEGACSDGLNFWVTAAGAPGRLVRF